MQDQPNILLVMTDQQRYDSLGCYGFEAGHTPNLDQFGSEGVVFEHCYVNNPICTPSRASLLTGKHIQGHGVYRLFDNLPEDEVLFTERLREIGFKTALFGKLHVSSLPFEEQYRNAHDGFDIYEWCLEHNLSLNSPFNAYAQWLKAKSPEFLARLAQEGRNLLHVPRDVHMTHWAAERTISFIREQSNSSQPFFCMMSLFDPHDPYEDYPLEMGTLISVDRLPDPIRSEGDLELKTLRRIHDEHFSRFLNPRSTADEVRKARLGYHASIALVDLEFGRVLEALNDSGQVRNTLVIYVSDHGDLLGDHQQYTKGAAMYDPCVRVPLMMQFPARFHGGQRLKQLVQPHDIAATVLSAAGITADQRQAYMPESVDLLSLCTGETETAHDSAICCFRNSGLSNMGAGTIYFEPPIHATMIRSERFKLIAYDDAGTNESEGQLFDMEDDPYELKNLWNDMEYGSVRYQLTQRLLDWEISQEVRYLGSRGGESMPKRRWWTERKE